MQIESPGQTQNRNKDFLSMRNGGYFDNTWLNNFWKSANFNPFISGNSYENWTSLSTPIMVDDFEYSLSPLNANSIDFLPFDFDAAQINKNITNKTFSARKDELIFDSPAIPDSTTLKFRAYIGSATGDPLIHSFTRQGENLRNVNKIPPSCGFLFADKLGECFYKINAGYYASYSTGTSNDKMISYIHPYYFMKENKSFIGSFVVERKFDDSLLVKFNAGFASYFGWEITPFITSFAHLENYLYTFNLKISNATPGVVIKLKSDFNIDEIHAGEGMLPAKFFMNENRISLEWNIISGSSLKIKAKPEVILTSFSNRESNSEYQQFFLEEGNKIHGRILFEGECRISPVFSLDGMITFGNHFAVSNYFSAGIKACYDISPLDKIELSFASTAGLPNINELYGRFGISHTAIDASDEQFAVAGNSELISERINKIDITAVIASPVDDLKLAININFTGTSDLIYQQTINSIRENCGRILRNARYVNNQPASIFGTTFRADYNYRFLTLYAGCALNYSEDIKYTPGSILSAGLIYDFPFGGIIKLSTYSRAKTVFEEFKVLPQNDFAGGLGFSGETATATVTNITFMYTFPRFYFARDLSLQIEIQNIFNEKLKYLPVGNSSLRTFLFVMQTDIL